MKPSIDHTRSFRHSWCRALPILHGLLFALVLIWAPGTAHAQSDAPAGIIPAAGAGAPAGAESGEDRGTLAIEPKRIIAMFYEGTWLHVGTMWVLMASSVLTLTMALERLIVLRSSRVIPKTFMSRFMDRLRDGELDRVKALELCRDNGSPIANIFSIIAEHWGRPAAEIRSAVSDGSAAELFYLRRRVRALNGMATLAPLLGLFGTVIGMIEAFYALSQHAGAGKTERLAEGISLALVATASGLAIAIVAAASYYFLLGRVERLIQEMDMLANQFVNHVAVGGKASEILGPTRPRVVPAREQASG